MTQTHTLKIVQLICILMLFIFTSVNTSSAQEGSQTTIASLEERITKLEKQVSELIGKLNTISSNQTNPSKPDSKTDTKDVTTKPANKPTDAEVRTAITESVKKKVPFKWINHLGNTSKTVIQTVSIKKWGVYNDRLQYWPINVQVSGSCDVDNMFSKENRSFNGTGDFRLMKNDYGTWVATFVE